MSTTTDKYGFIKPELTDAADITAYNDNWDKIDRELRYLNTTVITANSADGVSYTAIVEGLTELYNGLELTIVPDKTSTVLSTTLNVNGLGDKPIRLSLSTNTSALTTPKNTAFLVSGSAVKVRYDTSYLNSGAWKIVDKQKTSAQDLYGSVPISSGGFGGTTAAEARTNLEITPSNIGALPAVLTSYEYGTSLPAAGKPGRIFFKKVT